MLFPKLENDFIIDLFLNAGTLLNSPTLTRRMLIPLLFDLSVHALACVTIAVVSAAAVFLPVVTTAGVCQIHTVSSPAAIGQQFDICPSCSLPVLDSPTCERGPLQRDQTVCCRWTDRDTHEQKKLSAAPFGLFWNAPLIYFVWPRLCASSSSLLLPEFKAYLLPACFVQRVVIFFLLSTRLPHAVLLCQL